MKYMGGSFVDPRQSVNHPMMQEVVQDILVPPTALLTLTIYPYWCILMLFVDGLARWVEENC